MASGAASTSVTEARSCFLPWTRVVWAERVPHGGTEHEHDLVRKNSVEMD
jgi:hypothetical protein